MKRTLIACISLALVLLFATSSFAITEKEHQQYLKTCPEYAEADKTLNAVWKDVKDAVSKEDYKELLQEQRQWNKEKDSLARQKMKERPGLSYPLAAAYVMRVRSGQLNNNLLAAAGQYGRIKADSYFEEEEDRWLDRVMAKAGAGNRPKSAATASAPGRSSTRRCTSSF